MVWDRLAKALGFEVEKEKPTRQDILGEMNIYIVKDERLEERVKEARKLHYHLKKIYNLKRQKFRRPYELLDRLMELMEKANSQLDNATSPFWRGLSYAQAATIMRAWTEIHARFMEFASVLRNWFKRIEIAKRKGKKVEEPPLPQEVLVNAFLDMVIREYSSRADALVKIGWSEQDVTPSYIGTVQTMPLIQQTTTPYPFPIYDKGSIGQEQERNPPPVRRPIGDERSG